MCLRSPHGIALSFALSHLVHTPCFLCLTAVAIRMSSSRWISSKTIFLLFNVDSLDHQCRPRPALPFATEPIILFILRADSAFSTAVFAFYFQPAITEGWVSFTSRSWESCSIWKSHTLPNLNSLTSANVGSFSFVDELYRATFIKELGAPNHFFIYLLINHSIFSTFVIDTSYTCKGYENLGNNSK